MSPGPQEYPGSAATEVTEAQQADTAVFYSISSTQKGLAGIDLGNFLIKQVAQRVLTEFPNVQNLITLSPIPGFRSWLHTQVEAERTALRQGSAMVTSCASCLCYVQQLYPSSAACMYSSKQQLTQPILLWCGFVQASLEATLCAIWSVLECIGKYEQHISLMQIQFCVLL